MSGLRPEAVGATKATRRSEQESAEHAEFDRWPPVLKSIRVILGPTVVVDAPSVQRLIADATRRLGLDVHLVAASTDGELSDLIRASDSDALVVCAGTASTEALGPPVRDSGLPTVTVDITRGVAPPDPAFRAQCIAEIRGRGVMGVVWAIRHLVERDAWSPETVRYGDSADQVGDLRVPFGRSSCPVAVLLHGGGWAEWWTRDLMDGLAVDLARRGFASWNVEYRRVGDSDGGWPHTFDDVAAAVDHLAELRTGHPLDLDRVVIIGHSAGGQLALWVAARPDASSHAMADRPGVSPAMVVSLAGVTDLVEADRRGLGGEDAVAPFLGGRCDEAPGRYAATSPIALSPIRVPQLVVQGLADALSDLVEMNARYAAHAHSSGDQVELLELPHVDHLGVIDPTASHWTSIVDRIRDCLALTDEDLSPTSDPDD